MALRPGAISAFSSTSSSIRPSTMHRSSSTSLNMEFMTHYEEVNLETDHAMSIFDITPQIEAIVEKSGCKEGTVSISRALTIFVYIYIFYIYRSALTHLHLSLGHSTQQT